MTKLSDFPLASNLHRTKFTLKGEVTKTLKNLGLPHDIHI
jgi:hydrogenase maturation factor HypE